MEARHPVADVIARPQAVADSGEERGGDAEVAGIREVGLDHVDLFAPQELYEP